jgi:hypothetical protein
VAVLVNNAGLTRDTTFVIGTTISINGGQLMY